MMTAADLLRTAAENIAAALAQLNLATAQCGECGGKHFENKTHGKVNERFAELPEKLRTSANFLDSQPAASTPPRKDGHQ